MRKRFCRARAEVALPRLKVAWLGSDEGECAQLLERIRQMSSSQGRPLCVDCQAVASWDPSATHGADRIVFVAETRLDYPWQSIAQLQTSESCVPWGVVSGIWHAGSRRTGIGAVTHWQLPWYRWWDGWHGWFFPELARPGSQCMTQFEPITLPIDLATPSAKKTALGIAATTGRADSQAATGRAASGPVTGSQAANREMKRQSQLLIVSACRETATSWRLEAERAGWSSAVVHPRALTAASFEALAPRAAESAAAGEGDACAAPASILWDDSCQDRLPVSASYDQSREQCRLLAQRFPGVPIVAAVAIGHMAVWPQLKAAGVSEFFVKPSHGLPLADYLVYQGARTG